MRVTEKELKEWGFVEVSPGRYKKLSKEEQKEVEGKKSLVYGNVKSTTATINGKEYKFRSGWEYHYALYLQLLMDNNSILKWEYEPHRFLFTAIQRGTNSYLPDFKIYEPDGTHWWAEVKGHMSKVGATKLKRMAKYYPQEQIRLIRKEEIAEIRRKLGL